MKVRVFIFGMLSVFALAVFVSADYTGYLPYMTLTNNDPFDYTFNVSVNEISSIVTFTGIENPLDVINVNYDEAQSFTKRINWVWFDGWFDNQNMYISQYIGTGVVYSGAATQVSSGVYQAEVNLPNVPYFNIPLNMLFTVRIDTNNNVVQAWPTSYPSLVFEAEWDSQYGVAAQAFGPFLMEARLSGNNQQIEIEEWTKEDLSTNGLSPRWVVPLSLVILPVNEFTGRDSKHSRANDAVDSTPVSVKNEISSDVLAEDLDVAVFSN